jgi:hypothetical protein
VPARPPRSPLEVPAPPELSATAADSATVAYRTVQAEHPRRRAPLPRQVILALITVALDGVACYFAAQALVLKTYPVDVQVALESAVRSHLADR